MALIYCYVPLALVKCFVCLVYQILPPLHQTNALSTTVSSSSSMIGETSRYFQLYLSCLFFTLISNNASWQSPSRRAFFNLLTSSSSNLRPTASSSSFLLIFSLAFSSFDAFSLCLNRACIRIRNVVLNVIDSPSPRISGRAWDFADVEGLIVKNVSRRF